MRSTEHHLQTWFAMWLRSKGILFCASMAGVKVSMGTQIKMKRAGYQAGHPDIMIYEPRGQYHGMAVELKFKNKAQLNQVEWQRALLNKGYYSIIVPHDLDYQQVQIYLESEVTMYLSSLTKVATGATP
jgi:hypothetical protein